MNKTLLFLSALILSHFIGFTQVVANQPPDMVQCDNPVFDLTSQDAAILGTQNPALHMVQYYLSQSDATMGIGHIWNAEAYQSAASLEIFARVTHTGNQQFATISFWIHGVPQFQDETVCDSYIVPPFPPGIILSTQPGGLGDQLSAGDTIYYTQTVFVSNSSAVCPDDTMFTVTINQAPQFDYFLEDVTVCYSYTLPSLAMGNYYTGLGGSGLALMPGDVITESMFVYVHAGSGTGCANEYSFYVTVYSNNAPLIPDVFHCDSYVLPALAVGNYFSESGGMGTMYNAGDVITESMLMYVLLQDEICQAESSFYINFGSPPVETLWPVNNCVSSLTPYSVFNLDIAASNAVNGQPGYLVTFHETQADAQVGINPIGNQQAYANTAPLPVTLYVRVASSSNPDCTGFTTVVLNTSTCNTNQISGNVQNGPNCQSTIAATNAQVKRMLNGVQTFAYTNQQGNYAFNQVGNGSNVVSVPNIPGFTGTPASHSVAVSGNYGNYSGRNFCLAGTPAHDLSLNVYPLTVARPGMTVSYLLTLSNLGSSAVDGTLTLDFPDDLLSFVSPDQFSQIGSVLTHDFESLNALQSRQFTLHFLVGAPPAVMGGEILPFSGTVSTALIDSNPANNSYSFSQPVVNSYDPNDKAVVEGSSIGQAQAGDYLNYIVRFQNTGTADALKVVIRDQLDPKLDWSTFRPVASSHDFMAEMNQDGLVSFTFANINLPPEQSNELLLHLVLAECHAPLQDDQAHWHLAFEIIRAGDEPCAAW